MRRRQIEGAKVRAAPGEIGDELGHPQLADQLAGRRIDPDAAGAGAPDIAALIAFHAVGHARFELGADAGRENAAVGEFAVAFYVEHADQRLHGVVDVELSFVRREAEAVRLIEHIAVDEQQRLSTGRRQAVDALEAELAGTLHAEAGHPSVPGIGKIDRAARMHADIVRAVELLAAEMGGEHLAPPVRPLADQRRGRMLADDQIEVGVIGHAVAFVRRLLDLDDAVARIPAPSHICGHVGEQQMLFDRVPDGTFREGEARADLTDRRMQIDQSFEFSLESRMGHGALPSLSGKPVAFRQRLGDRPRHGIVQTADELSALDFRRPVVHGQQIA